MHIFTQETRCCSYYTIQIYIFLYNKNNLFVIQKNIFSFIFYNKKIPGWFYFFGIVAIYNNLSICITIMFYNLK